jgi:hypothetical protein
MKSTNARRKRFNDLIIAVAKDATGKDHGKTPKEWRKALAGGNHSSPLTSRAPPKATFGEMVPLGYNLEFQPAGVRSLTSVRVFVDT